MGENMVKRWESGTAGRSEMRERSEQPSSSADPRLLSTETPAPPEAVRAIAALLGRAAAPLRPGLRTAVPAASLAATPVAVQQDETAPAAPIGQPRDHEVLVEGEHSDLIRLAEHEMDRARRRAKRARRAVREALARISTPGGDELGG